MSLTIQQRLDRLKVRIDELTYWRVRERQPISGWTFEGLPIQVGAAWPRRDRVVHFSAQADVPENWPLEETRLSLDVGGESLLTIGDEHGHGPSFGIDPYHQEFSVAHRRMLLQTQSVARLPFGQPVREPHLSRAELIWLDPPVHRLRLLLIQIAETLEPLREHEVAPHLLEAAERTLRALDWPSATADYVARTSASPNQQKIWQLPELSGESPGLNQGERASVVAAHGELVAMLRALQTRFPPQGEVALTGHAHIDLAWLWPYAETRRKMRRTFHTAAGLMEGSDDFRFNQSTAHYYQQISEDDPALFEKIKAKVKSAQWEVLGGMWVEPDTNMPTGESLVRQILYGQRYFDKVFGARHTICWLPDCFGFSGALPQLLRQGGIESFFTIKVNWSETNKFPADLFWWEGLDGSRVLAHTFENPFGGYNGQLRPEALLATWKNFRGKTSHPQTLLAIGYGDGGGGVTTEMVERESQLRDFPVLPKARWGTVKEFFEKAHETAGQKRLPVWSGEIYLELHRATLTTQGKVKRLHRQAERSLITAETVASLAHLLGAPAPQNLEPDWRVVLKNEFHDILPGSSIREVYEDAEAELSGVISRGTEAQRAAMAGVVGQLPKGAVADALVVVNPSLSARPLRVVLPDGSHFATEDVVPPLGVSVLDKRRLQPKAGLSASRTHLENAFLRVELGEDGTVASLVHKPTGREALDGRGNQLWVYPVDKPRNWDAWDIEEDYAERGEEVTDLQSIDVLETGPHRAAIRIVRRFRNSTITQVLSLAANGRRLDIATELDWHDRRVFLRSLTPAAMRSSFATFECAFGVTRRPTHRNTSWDAAMFEAAAHRFIDLSERGFGLAVLNDGKYGHSVHGNVLGLSLLRSPVYPDPLADEGVQAFTYALMPHAGDWAEGGVREEAEDLNQPLLVQPASGLESSTLSPLTVAGLDVGLAGLKPAEEGEGLILRVYEPSGARGRLALELPEAWSNAGPVTILEEPVKDGTGDEIKPFEVRSWCLRQV